MSMKQLKRIRMQVEACPRVSVVKPSDILFMPRPLKTTLNLAFREGKITIADLARGLELKQTEAKVIAGILIQKGYFQLSPEGEEITYIARFGGLGSHSGGSLLDKL